jgi:putative alpha-1,2-mannosidase
MSAWYVFATMGFYPVNPANGLYYFGSPSLNKATINLPGGKTFKMVAENNSKQNVYIQSVRLNGKPYSKHYISHNDIMNGGELHFIMGAEPKVRVNRNE